MTEKESRYCLNDEQILKELQIFFDKYNYQSCRRTETMLNRNRNLKVDTYEDNVNNFIGFELQRKIRGSVVVSHYNGKVIVYLDTDPPCQTRCITVSLNALEVYGEQPLNKVTHRFFCLLQDEFLRKFFNKEGVL